MLGLTHYSLLTYKYIGKVVIPHIKKRCLQEIDIGGNQVSEEIKTAKVHKEH